MHNRARSFPLRRLARTARGLSAGLIVLLDPVGAVCQFQDADLPDAGVLRIELGGRFNNWSDRFALDSPDPTIADGDREPLHFDFDGGIANRLFPGPTPFIDDLNSLSSALGFTPVTEEEFSLGSLDFDTITRQRQVLELAFEYGIFRRLSLGLRLPIVSTEAEPVFSFDPTGSTVLLASSAFQDGGSFFTDFGTQLTALQGLIDGGTLDNAALQTAVALQGDAQAFLDALQGRSASGGFIPAAGSRVGMETVARFVQLAAGFESFTLALPEFGLPAIPDSAGFPGLFTDPPVSAAPFGLTDQPFTIGEIELGLRFGVFDGFDLSGRIRHRTTVGVKARIGLSSAGAPPFEDPSDFLDVPIGDGQTDVEVSVFEDVMFGDRFMLSASGRFGLQLADILALRIRPPEQPFALPETEISLERDLGDYVQLRLAPRFWLTQGFAIGAEYGLWSKATDRYDFAFQDDTGGPGVIDPALLELETRQTRHRVGFSLFYDIGRAATRDELQGAPREARSGWRLGFTAQRAIAGSGGQTPASSLVSAQIQIPLRIAR